MDSVCCSEHSAGRRRHPQIPSPATELLQRSSLPLPVQRQPYDPLQPRLRHRQLHSAPPPAGPLRPSTTHRSGTALREGMVRSHRDMSRHDHIPRRDRRMVSGHVLQFACGQGLGLDWRGKSRGSGAATA